LLVTVQTPIKRYAGCPHQ